MNNAFKYWETNAAETEASYPYKGVDGTCRYDASKGVVKVSDYKSIWPSESSLTKAVNEHVVSVAVDATNWKNYAGGIFDGECSALTLNHGVTLVGYGTENGQDYWRIKNSWTTSWGDNGYIKLKRTDSIVGFGQCGIARSASYPILA
jgi:C1A family cysteine protease